MYRHLFKQLSVPNDVIPLLLVVLDVFPYPMSFAAGGQAAHQYHLTLRSVSGPLRSGHFVFDPVEKNVIFEFSRRSKPRFFFLADINFERHIPGQDVRKESEVFR